MCQLCIDFAKNKITSNDVLRNLDEMQDVISLEHYEEIMNLIDESDYQKSFDDAIDGLSSHSISARSMSQDDELGEFWGEGYENWLEDYFKDYGSSDTGEAD